MGDPVVIDRFCLEWEVGGSAPPYTSRLEDTFTSNLATLGVNASAEGAGESEHCDAVLRVSLTGDRSSATYGPHRLVCWSGTRLEARAVLVIDGRERSSWIFEETHPPPGTIPWCPEEGDDIVVDYPLAYELWHGVFFETFGIRANLATWVNHDPNRGKPLPDSPGCWTGPPADDDLRVLMSLLSANQTRLVIDWLTGCLPGDQAARDSMSPLVPYLIRQVGGRSVDTAPLLEAITGLAFSSPEDWWGWWEAPGASPP